MRVIGLTQFKYPLLENYKAQADHDRENVSLYLQGYLRAAARGMAKVASRRPVEIGPSGDYIKHLRTAIAEFASISETSGQQLAPLDAINLYSLRIHKGGIWRPVIYKTIFSTAFDLGIPSVIVPHEQDRFDLIEGLPLLSSEHLMQIEELARIYEERHGLLLEGAKSRRVNKRTGKITRLEKILEPVLHRLVAA
jgi:hypothetical protein